MGNVSGANAVLFPKQYQKESVLGFSMSFFFHLLIGFRRESLQEIVKSPCL